MKPKIKLPATISPVIALKILEHPITLRAIENGHDTVFFTPIDLMEVWMPSRPYEDGKGSIESRPWVKQYIDHWQDMLGSLMEQIDSNKVEGDKIISINIEGLRVIASKAENHGKISPHSSPSQIATEIMRCTDNIATEDGHLLVPIFWLKKRINDWETLTKEWMSKEDPIGQDYVSYNRRALESARFKNRGELATSHSLPKRTR